MSLRWLNSFTILAVILIAIGVIGALSGGHMVFDPGREPSGREWMLYLVAGVLMLVNGLLPPATVREESDDQDVTPPAAGNRARAAGAAAATGGSVSVTAPVTAADPDR